MLDNTIPDGQRRAFLRLFKSEARRMLKMLFNSAAFMRFIPKIPFAADSGLDVARKKAMVHSLSFTFAGCFGFRQRRDTNFVLSLHLKIAWIFSSTKGRLPLRPSLNEPVGNDYNDVIE